LKCSAWCSCFGPALANTCIQRHDTFESRSAGWSRVLKRRRVSFEEFSKKILVFRDDAGAVDTLMFDSCNAYETRAFGFMAIKIAHNNNEDPNDAK
jgi:hypothetical protein